MSLSDYLDSFHRAIEKIDDYGFAENINHRRRPQFIKAAALSRAIAGHNRVTTISSRLTEVIVRTGQHYDDDMSAIFFRELEIPVVSPNHC